MNLQSSFKLNNGIEIPSLGLGTYLSKPGSEVYNAVRYALDIGYRHIDTAAFYNNEEDIGQAVRDSKIPRDNIFITTKVWNSDHGFDQTIKAFYNSLKKLNTDFIDLYLIHWPVSNLRLQTWSAIEKLYTKGLIKSIGVSNYTIRHLEELLNSCEIQPAVNQVEFSLYLYQKELLDFCSKHNIFIESYTPLARGKKLNDPKLISFAEKYGKTPAQILIKWTLEIGTISIPKSVQNERILENSQVFDFEFSDEDMEYLNSFNENFRVAWDPNQVQ